MSNLELIQNLQKDGILRTKRIIKAFQIIDRSKFLRPGNLEYAYEDEPIHIGFQQTISQPRTVAFMLEKLQPNEGEKVLDVGSGSGWTTALLAYIVGDEGSCIGIELIPDLMKFGEMNVKKFPLRNVKIIQASTDILGYPSNGPYDKILVSATSMTVPEELLAQLSIHGIMVIPIRNSIVKVSKLDSTNYVKEEYYGFSFVPLVRPKQT